MEATGRLGTDRGGRFAAGRAVVPGGGGGGGEIVNF